ncbi:MAG: hypothetical protein GYA55_10445 [SAR324 cluster bacterium]|uniref:Uncharacterized protein n=1 Tax=SAR324 cluster bacterium TaxID=2024889 RepID=A0A7X9IM18_9DELT|nr:hypothetical protein [SAR324 cluster bacterium]
MVLRKSTKNTPVNIRVLFPDIEIHEALRLKQEIKEAEFSKETLDLELEPETKK